MDILNWRDIGNTKKYMIMQITSLAWPVVAEMFCLVVGGVLTTAMVGSSFGAVEVASVGLAMLIQTCTSMVIAAAGIGAGALVSRAYGAGNLEDAREIAGQSLHIAIGCSIVASVLCFYGGKALVSIASPDKAVIEMTSGFLDIIAFFLPFLSVISVCLASVRAVGKTRVSMCVAVLGQLTSLSVTYFALFVFKIGVYGAIFGMLSSQILACFLSFMAVRWKYTLHLRFKHIFPLRPKTIYRIVKISAPAALEQLAIQSGRLSFSLLMATTGAVQYAGHNVAIQIESISFMPGMAFGIAAMTLVGQNLGRGTPHRAKQYAYMTCMMGALMMFLVGVLFFIFAEELTMFFIKDPEVIAWGTGCVRIAGIEQAALAVSMILPGVLRGSGDTLTAMYVAVVGVWFFRIPLILVLKYFGYFNVVTGWICASLDVLLRSIWFIFIIRKKRWTKM